MFVIDCCDVAVLLLTDVTWLWLLLTDVTWC